MLESYSRNVIATARRLLHDYRTDDLQRLADRLVRPFSSYQARDMEQRHCVKYSAHTALL